MNQPSDFGEQKDVHEFVLSLANDLEKSIGSTAYLYGTSKARDFIQPGEYPPGVLGALLEIRADLENLFFKHPKTLQFRPMKEDPAKRDTTLGGWANRERVEIFLKYMDRHVENSDPIQRETFQDIRQKVADVLPFLVDASPDEKADGTVAP